MLRFMIPLTVIIATATTEEPIKPWFESSQSVASESQIKFAIENEYDDTGPGAKQPEYAYSTYNTLEDALVAYLDDPDTQLPEHEREKAVRKFAGNLPFTQRFNPKTVAAYTGYQTSKPDNLHNYKLQRVQQVKSYPLSVAHYTRNNDFDSQDEVHHQPRYTFSYGVHDQSTGDSKTAQESRVGGKVQGFYSFRDADGKQRVVHYTADDKIGFQATVQKTGLYNH